MDKYIDKFSPEELDALRRCVSYGWRPAVTAKIMNCRYGFSLNAHDIEDILAELNEQDTAGDRKSTRLNSSH